MRQVVKSTEVCNLYSNFISISRNLKVKEKKLNAAIFSCEPGCSLKDPLPI